MERGQGPWLLIKSSRYYIRQRFGQISTRDIFFVVFLLRKISFLCDVHLRRLWQDIIHFSWRTHITSPIYILLYHLYFSWCTSIASPQFPFLYSHISFLGVGLGWGKFSSDTPFDCHSGKEKQHKMEFITITFYNGWKESVHVVMKSHVLNTTPVDLDISLNTPQWNWTKKKGGDIHPD